MWQSNNSSDTFTTATGDRWGTGVSNGAANATCPVTIIVIRQNVPTGVSNYDEAWTTRSSHGRSRNVAPAYQPLPRLVFWPSHYEKTVAASRDVKSRAQRRRQHRVDRPLALERRAWTAAPRRLV